MKKIILFIVSIFFMGCFSPTINIDLKITLINNTSEDLSYSYEYNVSDKLLPGMGYTYKNFEKIYNISFKQIDLYAQGELKKSESLNFENIQSMYFPSDPSAVNMLQVNGTDINVKKGDKWYRIAFHSKKRINNFEIKLTDDFFVNMREGGIIKIDEITAISISSSEGNKDASFYTNTEFLKYQYSKECEMGNSHVGDSDFVYYIMVNGVLHYVERDSYILKKVK